MSPALRAALAEVRRLMGCGVRPQLAAIAAHYHIEGRGLSHAMKERGIVIKKGRRSPGENAAHLYYAPHIALPGSGAAAGMPPLNELEDACARWGLDGAAEEYDVTEAQICAWLRAHGEAGEIGGRRKGERG